MAQTLEEFLISVKYQVDAPSQQKFFDTLKRVATSVAGVAGEITGLGIAILKISEQMAKAGEQLYWTSQRVGDSVTQIESMSFALSNLGVSAGEATAGIERFGAWTRNMGPAATGYLRSLGVTARDTVGQMRQLGEYFRSHGGTLAMAHGTDAQRLQYSIALRQAGLLNIDEKLMLAMSSGQLEQGERQAGIMRRLVWGKDAESGPQKFADQSLAVMNQFRQMGLIFHNLEQWFSLGLFNAILPDLKNINDILIGMLPDIERFLNHIISYAPTVLHFLEGAMKGFQGLLHLGNVAIEVFEKLPVVVQRGLEMFTAMPLALALIKSPLFWLITGFTALMLLMDDYQHWQEDQKTGSKEKHSLFDWSIPDTIFKGIGAIFNPIAKVTKELDAWFCHLTGIDHFFSSIAVTLGVILAKMAMTKGWNILTSGLKTLLGLGPKAPGATPGAGGGGGFFSGLVSAYRFIAIGEAMWDAISDPKKWKAEWEKALGSGHFGWGEGNKGKSPQVDPLNDLIDWITGRGSKGQSGPAAPPRIPKTGPTFGPQQQVGMAGGSGVMVASASDANWGVSSSFGGDIDDAGDRLYALLRDNLQVVMDHLSDILDTLNAIAIHAGVPTSSLPSGAGGGGGGGGESSFGPMLPPGAPLDQQEARLAQIMQRESGGRDVFNYKHASDPTHFTASGYYQMIDATWLHAARLAGIDTRRYPHAIGTPFELQHRAALALINEQGEGPWATSVRHAVSHPSLSGSLSHQPIGADGGAGSAGAILREQHRQSTMTQQNTTNISMTAPSPASAVAQLAEAMPRIHANHLRYAKGALVG
jgi:hypothetical protein